MGVCMHSYAREPFRYSREGMGGGWAETATGDPWWPEIVPELFEFSAWNETAGGEASLGAAITPIRAFVGQQVTYVANNKGCFERDPKRVLIN